MVKDLPAEEHLVMRDGKSPGVLPHTWNPSTQKRERGAGVPRVILGYIVRGQPRLSKTGKLEVFPFETMKESVWWDSPVVPAFGGPAG